MKKHENRIEIVGAYYLRIVIGRWKFDHNEFYETKSSAIRAARRISDRLLDSKPVESADNTLENLPIYDYDGAFPYPVQFDNSDIYGVKNAKYKIITSLPGM
jgi:hypothetical protein